MPEPVNHGERRFYLRGCRCLLCRAANARDKATRHTRALVDAAPVTQRLQALQADGIGYRRVAALTGLNANRLQEIRRGNVAFTTCRTAEKILSLPSTVTPSLWSRIPAAPTKRMMKWLAAEGFTLAAIAARIGARPRSQTITVRVAARVARLYREMQS